MSTRDVTDTISHSHNGETKSDSNTKETNFSSGKDCSTATTENKNECAEQFGEEFVTNFHSIKNLVSC